MASLRNHENGSANKFTVPINQNKILIQKTRELQNEDLTGTLYRDADKSLARPTSRCILFDG